VLSSDNPVSGDKMKVKVTQFCGLSTSPQIQAWLYRYNPDLYNELIEGLKKSRGCHQNRELMEAVYQKIVDNGDLEKLIDYLRTNFPHVLEDENAPPEQAQAAVSTEQDDRLALLNALKNVFSRRVVTFPRRTVVPVTGFEADVAADAFGKDKLAMKWLVHDNVLYIEYLLKVDEPIKDSILETNWLIPVMESVINGKEVKIRTESAT
jgi:hypothetical protein